MNIVTHVATRSGHVRPGILGDGWWIPERFGVWSSGRAALMLHAPAARDAVMLELSVHAFTHPTRLPFQRMAVSVNDHAIGQDRVGDLCRLAFAVPPEVMSRQDRLDIELSCPDAASPRSLGESDDGRVLGVAVSDIRLLADTRPVGNFNEPVCVVPFGPARAGAGRAAAKSPDRLAVGFQSLGHNCEFGLVQRWMGVTPTGLLSAASMPQASLVEGLRCGFEGLDAPGNITAMPRGAHQEWIGTDRRYGLDCHSPRTRADIADADKAAEMIRRSLSERLPFFRRALASGEQIWVYQHPGVPSDHHIWPLLDALRAHGPNKLLVVFDQRRIPAREPGLVMQIADDLAFGWVHALAPFDDVHRFDPIPWMHVLAGTDHLWPAA